MTNDAGMAARPALAYRPSQQAIHWIMAAIILGMLPLGFMLDRLPDGFVKNAAYEVHKSFGILVLLLAVARLVLRLLFGAPLPEPTLTDLQRRLSASVHHLIYVLIFVAPISGYVATSMCCAPVNLFWIVPMPIQVSGAETLMKAIFLVHKLATYALGGLVAAHIGAALMHAILLRDGVIWRMLPRGWRPAGR